MIIMGNTPEPDAAMKMLMPWWDLLTRYLTGGIMTIALSSAALQAAKDNLVCIPAVACKGAKVVTGSLYATGLESTCKVVLDKLKNDSATDVMTTMVDRRQYDFVDTLCFQKALKWYPSYFPFILVTMAAILLFIDNIWVLYPKTGSALNHFVTLTMECYSAVGTNLDIFRVLSASKDKGKKEDDGETDDDDIHLDDDQNFDLKQAMALKSLYDKVDQFRSRHGGKKRLLIKVYIVQATLDILFSVFCLCFVIYFLPQLSNSINCEVKEVFNFPYQFFKCSRFIAPYYRAVTLIFSAAMITFLLTSIYTLIWTCRSTYRKNIFAGVNVDDNTDVRGDLAFLFCLLEQYNKLYCDRLSLFLSKGYKATLAKQIKVKRKTVKRDGSDGKGKVSEKRLRAIQNVFKREKSNEKTSSTSADPVAVV